MGIHAVVVYPVETGRKSFGALRNTSNEKKIASEKSAFETVVSNDAEFVLLNDEVLDWHVNVDRRQRGT